MRLRKNDSENRNYDGLVKNRQKRKRWQQIVSTLVCIVVFCTTYALILPAITISGEATCGLVEHTHTTECYEQIANTALNCVTVHSHSDGCYNADGELACGLSDQLIHIHNEYCLDADGVLVCELEEFTGHLHSSACYTVLLSEDGSEETDQAVLTCGKEGLLIHSHTAACLGDQGSFICGLLETVPHVHSATCMRTTYTQGNLTCELQEHVHTEECYEEFPEDLRSALMLMSTASTDSEHNATEHSSVYTISGVTIDHTISNTEYDTESGTYDVSLRFDWTLDYSVLSNDNYKAFHIKLPDNLIIPDDLLGTWFSFTDDMNGMIAFDARFEKLEVVGADGTVTYDYYVHIEYRDDYISAVSNNETIDNYIEFKGQVDKNAVNEDGKIELTWGNGTTTTITPDDITYPPDETLHYDIATQKTASYDSVNDQLIYTVKVSSEKGTPSPINISDVLTTYGITLEELDSITVVDQDGNALSQDTNSDYYYTYTPNLAAGTLDVTIGTAEVIKNALEAGEYYLITYVYDIGDIKAGTVIYPNNTVTATATDTTTQETVTSSANASVKVDKEMVNKTGSYDPETGLITWTIVVNPDGDNIAGYVLTDDMMKVAQSLSVKVSNIWNETYESLGYTVDYDTGTVTFSAVDANNTSNTNTYTITYTTKHDQTTADMPINNTVVLKDNDGEEIKTNTGTAGVTVPSDSGITKDGILNADTGIINWSVTVDVPEGGIGAGTVITDKLGPSWGIDQNHWLTQKQIYDLAEALKVMFPDVDYTLEFSTDSWNWTEYSAALNDTSTSKYYCWRLTFNETVSDATDFTINYSTTADLSSVTSEVTYQNTVQMGSYSAWDSVSYKLPVTKLDRYYRPGTTDVSSSDGIIGWFVKISPHTNDTTITVKDVLPEGVTLTKLGVGLDGNTATSCASTVSNSGTVKDWQNLKADYTVSGNTIDLKITSQTSGANLPDSDIYVYIECLIDELPGPGGTLTESFTNTATVNNYSPVTQTQNITVTIPERVIKTDSNGNEADSFVTYDADNRVLGWYVKIYFDQAVSDTITITDTLPAGLTLTKVGLDTNSWNARYSESYYSSVSSATQNGTIGSTDATYTASGQTLTVTTDADYEAGTYLYLYVEGTFDAITNGTTEYIAESFENNVSVKAGDTDLGSDKQKQTVNVPPPDEKAKVDKIASWNGTVNQLNYQVLINQEGKNLSESGDTIEVKDVLSYDYNIWWNTIDSALIPGSVKLYEAQTDADGNVLIDSNGNYLLGNEVTDGWAWTYSDNFADVQGGGTLQNTITATVPDEKALILVYTYEISVRDATSGWLNITNSVTVTGDSSYGDNTKTENTWEATEVSGGATSSGTYTVHKVQTGNYNIVLPGAEFTIYKYADDTPLMDADGNIIKLTSNDSGVVKISSGLGYFEEDVVYYIVETKAPSGYDLPENPTKYYFYYKGESEGSYYVPDGAVDLSSSYGIAYVENTPEEQHLITVGKQWLDASGNPISAPMDSISFHLIQTDYKGNSEHFFHDTLKDGIQIYAHHSVIWTAPATGTVTLDLNDVEIHNLLTGDTITLTDLSFEATEGTPYQIMLKDGTVNEMTWNYSDGSDTGKLKLDATDWTTTIVVPEQDEEGNVYSYTAQEIKVDDNYVSEVTVDENDNITITNRQKDSTSITVEKAWRNPNMTQKPVQIQLYQTIDKFYTEYTAYLGYINGDGTLAIGSDSLVTFTTAVKGAGTYTIKWDLSLYGFKDSVGTRAFYIDIVDPYFALEGYTVSSAKVTTDKGSYTLNGTPKIGEHGGGITRITFYNIYDDYMSLLSTLPEMSADGWLEVEFTLAAPTNDTGELPPLSAYIPSANSGGTPIGDPITVNADSDWTYTWDGLPLTGTDSNGNLVHYSYHVEELSDEYGVRYTYQYGIKSGTIVVSNYPKSTANLIVNKQWLDANGQPAAAPVDKVQYKVEQEKLCTVAIYTGGWGADNNSVQYMYVKPGTVITLTFIGNVINNPENYDYITVTDGDETETFTGADLKAIYDASDDSVQDDAFDVFNETYAYGYLGEWRTGIRQYTVVRTITNTDIPTYISCNHGGSPDGAFYDGTYTMNNGGEITLGIVSISQVDPENYTPEFRDLGVFDLTAADGWTFTHEDVYPAIYRVTEVGNDYPTTYVINGGTAFSGDYAEVTLVSGEEGTVTINNTTASTSITVNKVWQDNGENSDVSRIAVTLHQVVNGTDVEFGDYYLTKDSSGNWALEIEGLPIKDADGNFYTYYIVESNLDGYYTTYTSTQVTGSSTTASNATLTANQDTGDDLGTITITNKAVTSIGVKKIWADGVTPTAVRLELWYFLSSTPNLSQVVDADGNVDLEALKTAGAVQKRVVYINCCGSCTDRECTSSKSKTFKNLDLYQIEDGKVTGYYTYFIVEVASGYVKTYSADSFMTGGSYTITNDIYKTQIGVDKVWSDGSTTPVDVTLYQQAVYYHTHDYETVVTAATCTAQGYTTYTCKECGFTYKSDYTEMADHSFSAWLVTEAATCAKAGTETRQCSVCQTTETRELPKLTADTDHSWDTGVVQDGYRVYTCSVCNGTKKEQISTTCSHANTTTTTTDATCTTGGKAVVTCTDCGVQISETTTDPNGHSYGDWYTVTAATCVAKGEQRRDCSNCDAYETQEIAVNADAHSFTNYVSNNNATCTADGTKTATCDRDGCTETDTVTDTGSKKAHSYVDGKCEVCNAEETDDEVVFFSGSHVYSQSDELKVDFPEGFVFSTGGTFSVECKPTSAETDSASIYIKLRWNQNQWEGTDILGWTNFSGTTTYSFSYEQLVAKLGDNVSKIISLEIGGSNLTITSVTWTPASTSATALSLNNVSLSQVYLDAGTAGTTGVDMSKVVSVGDGVIYSTQTVTPGTTTTWTDLPRYILDDEGNIIGEYVYYVVEAGGTEYNAQYTYKDANGNVVDLSSGEILGISQGSVEILNTQQYHYELPTTGGEGTTMYTLGGIVLLISAAFVLMYIQNKGRKGAMIP